MPQMAIPAVTNQHQNPVFVAPEDGLSLTVPESVADLSQILMDVIL